MKRGGVPYSPIEKNQYIIQKQQVGEGKIFSSFYSPYLSLSAIFSNSSAKALHDKKE